MTLAAGPNAGGDVALVLVALGDRRRFPVGLLTQPGMHLRVTGQALPVRPLCRFLELCAAVIASHSVGATTPTRLPLTMTCAFGYFALSSVPAATSVEPSVFGCTMRPWSMFGSRTSVTHVSLPATFAGVTVFAWTFPMIVYWLTGFIGGSPVTVRPNMLVRSPDTGIVELQLLALHELTVRDALAAAGHDTVLHRELTLVHAQRALPRDRAGPDRYRLRPS